MEGTAPDGAALEREAAETDAEGAIALEMEAAETLGFSMLQKIRYVIVPHVAKVLYAPIANLYIVFILGSALAGAAGVMAGAYYGKIDFLMGFIIGLKAFTAAVIGGIGNIRGAVLGAIVLGLLESFGTAWLGSQWRDVFAFGFLILFLTVRPTGLLGERVTERV